MNVGLLRELDACYERALAACTALADHEWRAQYHPDLSPVAWHLGHLAAVGAHWTQLALGGEPLPAKWRQLYFPEGTPKRERAQHLPDRAALLPWLDQVRAHTLARLSDPPPRPMRPDLLRDNYLLHFLIQHHEQHIETLQQVLHQRALKATHAHEAAPLAPATPATSWKEFDLCEAEIGHAGGVEAYDNELPRHRRMLAPFALAPRAVSNGEYLGFMQTGGYRERRYWSDTGWHWREATGVCAPDHWRRGESGAWLAIVPQGAVALDPLAPVTGISYYEAEAYARYAGARLPRECEWETAMTSGAIAHDSVGAWEWCAQPFYPYPGFRAFPYREYSVPWFDGHHYALRGGSVHTSARIKRPTFRNYYTADKRHIFAGVRLAQDR